LPQAIINAEINQTYNKLKALLIQSQHNLTAQDPPTTITTVQGSIWGTQPKTAKKQTTFKLQEQQGKTQITSTTRPTQDYKTVTIIGCIFSAGLMLLCLWIGWDLQNYAASGASVWSWLAWSNGTGRFEPNAAALLVRVTWVLAAFLTCTLIVEGLIVGNIHAKIDAAAEETLKAMHQNA
jgi:hypothetical protein